MSFTSNVKTEISKLDSSEIEKISELSAIILSGTDTNDECIRIITENASVARRIFNLIKDIYQYTPLIIVRKNKTLKNKYVYILQIKEKIEYMLNDLGIYHLKVPKEYIYDDDESIRAYLRGIFLMTGSINDPKKSRYHLEFSIDNLELANFVSELLNKYYLNSKVIKRENKYMVYIKEAEKIGDFLRIINAYNAVMYYEDIRIYRDHKNMTNRLNNCEQANVDRIIETSNSQVNDIELIISKVGFDLLDEKERIVCEYRMKYKDVSLQELSEIISFETGKKITKSGLYHRFKKISELASKLK